jgi:inner membrane protein
METYALLFGSLGIFVILAMLMYASQKVKWYREE